MHGGSWAVLALCPILGYNDGISPAVSLLSHTRKEEKEELP
jgi:hypothetical protein